jgi:hypothetical protein
LNALLASVRVPPCWSRSSRGNLAGYRLNLADRLVGVFRTKVIAFAKRQQTASLVPFSASRMHSDGAASYVEPRLLPAAEELLDLLSRPLNLTPFTPAVMEREKPRMYVVSAVVENPNVAVHLVRHLDASYRLDRSRHIPLIWSNGTYDELREEPLLFSDSFDAILTSSVAIIVEQRGTEGALGVLEEVRERSRKVLKQVTSGLRIKNFDEFSRAVISDLNMLRRLRSIEELAKHERYQQAMTMDAIVALSRGRPDLALDIDGSDGSEELVFYSDPQRRWRLLQLLDDSFVRSLITEIEYGANSKHFLT